MKVAAKKPRSCKTFSTLDALLAEDGRRESFQTIAMDEVSVWQEKQAVTYQTGTIGAFMRWTKRLVTNLATAAVTPKRWFDSDETSRSASGDER